MNRFSRILHHTDINDIKQKNSDRIAVLKLEEQERKNKLIKLRELSNPNFSDWRTDLEEGMTTKGTFQTVLGGQGEEDLSDYDTTTDIDQWGNVAYDNGITPESTVGVNIGEAGTGSGDDGGFNIDGGYLNFNDTKSQIIIPKIDLTIYDEIVVTAIRGNGSNGGISPTATYGDLELLWATPRSNINDGTPSYLYPNMNENGVNQASGTVAEYHQKYNQFIPSNNVFWNTYDPSDTGLRDWAVPIPEWMRFEDVALIIGKYNNAFTPGTYGITKVAFRRVKPITLFVSLDSPEATSFVRLGGGSSPSTPKKRKKKVEDQLQASKEYTDKVLGKEFPGSGTVLDPKPAETTPTRNYDDLAKDYKAAGSLDDQLSRFLSGGLSSRDVQAQAEPQADAEPVSDSQAASFTTNSDKQIPTKDGAAILGADAAELMQQPEPEKLPEPIDNFQQEFDKEVSNIEKEVENIPAAAAAENDSEEPQTNNPILDAAKSKVGNFILDKGLEFFNRFDPLDIPIDLSLHMITGLVKTYNTIGNLVGFTGYEKMLNNIEIARSNLTGRITNYNFGSTQMNSLIGSLTPDKFNKKHSVLYKSKLGYAISDERHEYADDNIKVINGKISRNDGDYRSHQPLANIGTGIPSIDGIGKGYGQMIIPKDGSTPYFHYYDYNYNNLNSPDSGEVPGLVNEVGAWITNQLRRIMPGRLLDDKINQLQGNINTFSNNLKERVGLDGWPPGIHGATLTDFKISLDKLPQETQEYIKSHPLYYDRRVDAMSEDELNAESNRLYMDTYEQDAQASERISEEAMEVTDKEYPELNQYFEDTQKEREKFEETKKVYTKELGDALTTRVDLAKFQRWNPDFEGTLNDYMRGTQDKAWARRYASLSGVDLGEVDKLMKDYDLGARNKFFLDGKFKEGIDSDYTWARSQPEYKEAEVVWNDAKKATEAAYKPYKKALDVAAAFENSLPRHPTKKNYVTGTPDQIAELNRLAAIVAPLRSAYDKAQAEEEKYIYEPGNLSSKLVKERRDADDKARKISDDAEKNIAKLYDEAGAEVDRLNALAKEKFEPEPLDDKIIDAYIRGFTKVYNRLWFERDGMSADPWNPERYQGYNVADADVAGAGGSPGQPYTPPKEDPTNPYVPAPGKDTKIASGKTEYGKTDYGLKKDGSLGMPDDNWGKDVGDEDDVLDLLGGKRAKRKRGSGYSIDEPIVSTAKKKKKRNTMAASYKPQGGTLKETTFDRIKKVRKKFDYEGKPTPTDDGYPENPPAELGKDGFHSEYGKNSNRYKKLDPISAKAMARVKTGDPETDAVVQKQAKKKK